MTSSQPCWLCNQPKLSIGAGLRFSLWSCSRMNALWLWPELRQGYSEEAAFTWMSLVIQAVDSIHQVSIYSLALVQQNSLPRTPFGGINYHAVKRLFSEGQLHPCVLLLCPHSAIQNLPQPRQPRPSLVGPSAIMCGQVVQGVRMAEARGRPIPPCTAVPSVGPAPSAPDGRFQLLTEILIWRATHTPDDRLFTVYNPKGQEACTLTCAQLLRRSERLGCMLLEKAKANVGTVIALVYPPGTEMICAFYACYSLEQSPYLFDHLLVWIRLHLAQIQPVLQCPVPICTYLVPLDPDPLPDLANLGLEAVVCLHPEESFRKKVTPLHQNPCMEQPVAYLDFTTSTTGTVTGIRVTHQVVHALCRAQKVQCEFYPTREVVLSLDPYSGLGFTLWALTSVYCGHHSILVPPSVSEVVPDLWLTVCSQRKGKEDFFLSPFHRIQCILVFHHQMQLSNCLLVYTTSGSPKQTPSISKPTILKLVRYEERLIHLRRILVLATDG
ncbi:hypothetical protein AHF37_04811 [Paragonimus kellicotti]|nr:hypothetical protein AHF37_04811 [Paragonimus kellicotti]